MWHVVVGLAVPRRPPVPLSPLPRLLFLHVCVREGGGWCSGCQTAALGCCRTATMGKPKFSKEERELMNYTRASTPMTFYIAAGALTSIIPIGEWAGFRWAQGRKSAGRGVTEGTVPCVCVCVWQCSLAPCWS